MTQVTETIDHDGEQWVKKSLYDQMKEAVKESSTVYDEAYQKGLTDGGARNWLYEFSGRALEGLLSNSWFLKENYHPLRQGLVNLAEMAEA